MTRIISGIAKGRTIKVPRSGTRPTSDRVREAVFTSLTSRLGSFTDLNVLDLFAGSGAFALEAISRGANTATCVEKHPDSANTIKGNAKTLSFEINVKTSDVATYLKGIATQKFDLVFIDPPYEYLNEEIENLLHLLIAGGWLTEDAVVVVERSARGETFKWPEAYSEVQERTYGETTVKTGIC
ncbi:MAG: rRNA ((966)-N(2))-methyltransferase RsmD [Actinomycetota bacterium]|jgi:16S rRNA (guanine966-N2)-methyltransferase